MQSNFRASADCVELVPRCLHEDYLSIDDELLAQANEIALRSDQSLSSIIEEALRESLARRTQAAPGTECACLWVGDSQDKPLVDILDREALAETLGGRQSQRSSSDSAR